MLKSRAGIDYIEKYKIIRRWKEYTEDLYKKIQTLLWISRKKHIYMRTIGDEK